MYGKTLRAGSALAGLAATTALLTGCATGSDTSAGTESSAGSGAPALADRTYAIANYADANPQLKFVVDSFESIGKVLGVDSKRFDNKGDPTTTLDVARLMVQAKPTLAIDWAAQPQLATSLGKTFSDAKLPCIAMSTKIDGCSLFSPDTASAGDALAAAAVPIAQQRGWTADDVTVLILSIPGGGTDVNAGVRNFYSTFASKLPGMEQIKGVDISDKDVKIGDFNGYQVGGGEALQAANASTLKAVQVIPKDRNVVIIAMNDEAARGALQAVKSVDRSGGVMVVSQGSDAEALDALRAGGDWAIEGDHGLPFWGAYVYALADGVLAGKSVPDEVYSPFTLMTTDTVDDYYDGSKVKKAPALRDADKPLLDLNLEKYLDAAVTAAGTS